VPKKQTTAAKKARAIQREAGGKYTTLLAAQAVCGEPVHPLDDLGACARPPHPADEPCSLERDWDPTEWKARAKAAWEAEEARRAALSPEERADEDEQAREWEHEQERAALVAEYAYDKYYGDVD
jgi:hypothetical protein